MVPGIRSASQSSSDEEEFIVVNAEHKANFTIPQIFNSNQNELGSRVKTIDASSQTEENELLYPPLLLNRSLLIMIWTPLFRLWLTQDMFRPSIFAARILFAGRKLVKKSTKKSISISTTVVAVFIVVFFVLTLRTVSSFNSELPITINDIGTGQLVSVLLNPRQKISSVKSILLKDPQIIPIAEQSDVRLYFDGDMLDDSQTIKSYHIKSGDCIDAEFSSKINIEMSSSGDTMSLSAWPSDTVKSIKDMLHDRISAQIGVPTDGNSAESLVSSFDMDIWLNNARLKDSERISKYMNHLKNGGSLFYGSKKAASMLNFFTVFFTAAFWAGYAMIIAIPYSLL